MLKGVNGYGEIRDPELSVRKPEERPGETRVGQSYSPNEVHNRRSISLGTYVGRSGIETQG